MKIRTLKKFLKVYKPIIEFKLPDTIHPQDIEIFKRQVAQITGGKYLVFISQVPQFTVTKPKDFDLEEFKKEWYKWVDSGIPILLSGDEEPSFQKISQDFITIHSPFKIPLSVYKSKLEQLKSLVNKLN